MKSKHQAEWQRDLEKRQRNVVFPDTAENEATLWRNLGARQWNGFVIAGLVLVCLTLALSIAGLISIQFKGYDQGTFFQRVLQAFGTWIILLAAIAGGVLIGWIIQSRKNSHER